jgi:hypothetical protein
MKNFCLFILFMAAGLWASHAQPSASTSFSASQHKNLKAISNALEFDGFEDYVSVANGTALIAGLDEFSMCGWVYPTNPNAAWPDFDGWFGIKSEGICDFYIAQINGVGIEARITTNQGQFTINPNEISEAFIDEWHHYALVFTGQELQIYLDGELDGFVPAEGTIDFNNLEVTFGKLEFFENDFFLDGRLDEITFWDKALTEDDLSEVMCISGDPGAVEGLTAYYDFNEESGWVLPDYFGNYDGVLMAMTGDEWVESDVCEAGFEITFTVIDELTSEPVEGAEVNLEGVLKTTDENGVATYTNYDPGNYIYNVTHPDYYDASGEVEVIDQDITEEVLLPPIVYYSMTFVVTEDPGSMPVDSAIVNVGGLLKYTDETGMVTFDGYLPGTYNYNVSKPGYFLVPGTATITDDDLTIEVTLVISQIDESNQSTFKIYPNPAQETLFIDHPGAARELQVRILTPDGRCVSDLSDLSKNEPLKVPNLTSGLYFVEITLEGERTLKKLMIE